MNATTPSLLISGWVGSAIGAVLGGVALTWWMAWLIAGVLWLVIVLKRTNANRESTE